MQRNGSAFSEISGIPSIVANRIWRLSDDVWLRCYVRDAQSWKGTRARGQLDAGPQSVWRTRWDCLSMLQAYLYDSESHHCTQTDSILMPWVWQEENAVTCLMREQGWHVGANTEVSHLTETGFRWLGPCHSSSQVGPRGGGGAESLLSDSWRVILLIDLQYSGWKNICFQIRFFFFKITGDGANAWLASLLPAGDHDRWFYFEYWHISEIRHLNILPGRFLTCCLSYLRV
jgi:hypothetical protein